MNNKKKLLTVLAVCVAVGVVAVSFMGMMPSGGDEVPAVNDESLNRTVVQTAAPHRGDITVSASFVGTVEPGQTVTVYPKAAGEVLLANFSVGDTVEAGDILFQIDSTTLEYTIRQTQADLANAEAQTALGMEVAQRALEDYTGKVDDGLNTSLIQAESALIQAQAAVDGAELELEAANNSYRIARNNYNNYRVGKYYDTTTGEQVPETDGMTETLRNAVVSTELAIEGKQLALENAKIALETAQTSFEATQRAITEGAVSVQDSIRELEVKSDMTSAYIGLEQLRTTLADYTVRAPISGVIEARNVDPFDMVSAGVPSYVISNVSAMTVSFNVTESTLGYMRLGDVVTIEKNGQTALGTVSEISTGVSAGGLYTVKATITNAPFSLYSGSTVKLYADTQKVEGELLVPIDAVYYDNGTAYVYLFENNTAVRREIVTGISDDTNIHVVSGLTGSEDLIVTWSGGLFNGAEVYLPGAAPAAPAQDDGEAAGATDETATGEETDTADTDEAAETGEQTVDGEDRGDGAPGGEAEEEAA